MPGTVATFALSKRISAASRLLVLMLELSAYFVLVQIWSAIAAAAILGAVNFAIAG